ncbi:MAG: hypothetical protein GQE15_40135 [Archangiaceae bacterium]|nr:hypothetical protein [Archangiaceae bacterium]
MNPAPIVISAFGIPWALLATFKLAPTFLGMFADFGSELPKLTQLMVTPWAPLALAFAGLAVVAATLRFSKSWVPLAVAIITTLLQPAIFVMAMYLPIFSIAGRIQ